MEQMTRELREKLEGNGDDFVFYSIERSNCCLFKITCGFAREFTLRKRNAESLKKL